MDGTRALVAMGVCAGLVVVSACGGSGTAELPTGAAPDLGNDGDPLFPDVGNPGYDVEHYDWALEVEPESGQLELRATAEAVATDDLDGIWFDYTGPELSEVTLDGEAVEHALRDGKLVVAAERSRGDRFELVTEYADTPESRNVEGAPGRFGWIATGDGVHTTSVFPGNTASWVPLNDTPLDPATYEISVTAPAPYVATASGTLVDVREGDGVSTFDYRVEEPVTEVTVVVGEYVVERLDAGDVDVDIALPARGSSADVDSFADVPRMIEFLADLFGPFPFPSVGFTVVPGLTAQADSTPGRINTQFTGADLLVHELAHQWMGGIVGTASTADSWLREGLPTYVEFLWLEAEGRATVDGTVAQIRDRLSPSTRVLLDVTSPRHRADDVVYERSALVMHALHRELGDEVFRDALHRFFRDHAGTSATTDDFIAVMSETSGRDLDDFFDGWLRSASLPPPVSP